MFGRFLSRAMVVISAGLLAVPATAGEMTRGLDVMGGKNGLAGFTLNRVGTDGEILKLRLEASDAQELQGYGLVLHFDPARYTFVEAREVPENLLETASGKPHLFFAVNNVPGQVAVGSMKVDEQAGSGTGGLVEFVFETHGDRLPGDFQILDGIMVDLSGALDRMQNVEIGPLTATPSRFALEQNTPNPFNPATSIAYQLPEAGEVRLAIYNLLGQEVQVLVNAFQDAGAHTVVWDGKDALGRQVASGIYMYRMDAEGFQQTRRMMLLK